MGEPVEECSGHAGIVVEDRWPVTELQVAREDKGSPRVAVGQEDEEELGLVSVETNKPEFIADEEVDAVELGFEPGQAMLGLRLGELSDEGCGSDKSDAFAHATGGNAKGDGGVGLAGTGWADRHDHLMAVNPASSREVGDE